MNQAPMPPPPALARVIDRFTGGVGRVVAWLTLAMILIGAANAIVRYGGRFIGVRLSSNAYLELQWYLFSVVFLLGAAYALREDSHVRVDIFYSRLSARGQSIINIIGTVVFLMPFSLFLLWISYPVVRNSWQVREMSPDARGLPRYPIKALLLVSFALLLLQGLSQLIKEVHRLRHHAPPPRDEIPAEGL